MATRIDMSNVGVVSDIDGVFTHLEGHIDRPLPEVIRNSRRASDLVRSGVSTYVEFFGIGKKAVERRFAASHRMDWSSDMINAHRFAEESGMPFFMGLTSNGHSQLIKEQLTMQGLLRVDAVHSSTLKKPVNLRQVSVANPDKEIIYFDDNIWQAFIFKTFKSLGFFKGLDNIRFVLVEAEHNGLAVRLVSKALRIESVERKESEIKGLMIKAATRER